MKRLPKALVFAVLTLAVYLVIWFPIPLDDQWWHMLTGRYVLEHGTVPTTEPFSFTANGEPWVNWEWPAGVVMFEAYEAFGGWGLVALRFVAVFSTIAIVWRHLDLVESDGDQPVALPMRLLILTTLLMVIFGRVADRPHVYALPFVAGSYLVASLAARRGGTKYLVLQIALMVPWSLFHPSWLLGVLVHTAVLADAWLAARADGAKDAPVATTWLHRLSPILLIVPALAVHPISQYVAAVASYFKAMNAGAASVSPKEWLSLWEFLHWTNTPLIACILLMVARLVAAIFDRASLRRPSTWLVLGLLGAAWWFVRFTPEFAVLAVPQIHAWVSTRWKGWGLPRRTANLATGLLGASAILLVVATKDVYQRGYTCEIDASQNPVRIGDFMERHELGGNVVSNQLNADAYLAFRRYPHVREYIDGRIPQAFSEAMFLRYRDAFQSPDQLDALIDESGAEHVVLQGVFSPETTGATFVLSRRGDFELVHIDATGMLWTKKTVLDALSARPARYRYVIPPLIDDAWFEMAIKPKHFPRVVEELTRLLAEEPGLEMGIALADSLSKLPQASDEQRAALAPLLQPR